MTENIINCYELDLKQDIPAEMEILKSSNGKLEKSNRIFKIILWSIGIGIAVFTIYQIQKRRKRKSINFDTL